MSHAPARPASTTLPAASYTMSCTGTPSRRASSRAMSTDTPVGSPPAGPRCASTALPTLIAARSVPLGARSLTAPGGGVDAQPASRSTIPGIVARILVPPLSGWVNPVVKRDAAVDDNGRAGDVGAEALGEHRDGHAGDVGRRAEASERNLFDHSGRRLEAAARDRARSDRIDADAVRPERARELLHEHGLAGLGGAVVRQVARRFRVKRSHDQDPALDLLIFHVAAELLPEDECRIEIDREHLSPLGVGRAKSGLRFLAAWARGMDEDRHAPELADRLIGKLFRVPRV